jgi:hypothetical protein
MWKLVADWPDDKAMLYDAFTPEQIRAYIREAGN